jgi:hypothetical protein
MVDERMVMILCSWSDCKRESVFENDVFLHLRSGMKEAKLCVDRPFPFLFHSTSIVVLHPQLDPGIRYALHTSAACLFSSTTNLSRSLLPCYAET